MGIVSVVISIMMYASIQKLKNRRIECSTHQVDRMLPSILNGVPAPPPPIKSEIEYVVKRLWLTKYRIEVIFVWIRHDPPATALSYFSPYGICIESIFLRRDSLEKTYFKIGEIFTKRTPPPSATVLYFLISKVARNSTNSKLAGRLRNFSETDVHEKMKAWTGVEQ